MTSRTRISIEIAQARLEQLNGAAVAEVERALQRYGENLVGESERLEASQRTSRGAPEITSQMVRDADMLLRKSYVRPPRSRWTTVLQVLSYVGAIGASVAATELDTVWGQILFAISLVGGIVSLAVMETRK